MGECIFKNTFEKHERRRMAMMVHNEVVYVVAKTKLLAKSGVMIVDEVKCILMCLNLIKTWLFENCSTCGE